MTSLPEAHRESAPAAVPGDLRADVGVRRPGETPLPRRMLPPRPRRSIPAAQWPVPSSPATRAPAEEVHLTPNLIVAGVTHCGARRFCAELARHPEIATTVNPRIDHYTSLRFGVPPRAVLEDYDRDFATWHGERYRVEISPVYFDGGPQLVEQVAADLPDVRILIILRDPVQRILSSYVDKRRRRRLPKSMSFEDYVARCLALRANGSDLFEGNRYFRTLSGGIYVDHLQHWWDAFGDRVLVALPDSGRPGAALSQVGDWLELDLEGPPAKRRRDGTLVDPGQFRSRWLETFEMQPEDAEPPQPTASGRHGWSWVERTRRRPGVERRGDERALRMVEAFYQPGNRRLATELMARGCRDLPRWLVQA